MPVFDNHIHFRSSDPLVPARQFQDAGGTHLLLTHAPWDDRPVRGADDYAEAFERTLAVAERVRAGTSLTVFVALGPYPVELLRLAESTGVETARDAQIHGMELAATHVREGRAIALGEIGRPHFPVEPALLEACNAVLEHGMRLAKEAGCAVVLHAEDPTEATFAEWASLAGRAGLPSEKVVKHHSTPIVAAGERTGVWPSVLAKETLVRQALAEGTRFLLETDFMDDPRRPGAVLAPATVPKKTRRWRGSGLLSDEASHAIHVENPRRVYGIEID